MKIHGIGLPFSPHQSSCSNRTPTNFTWTDDKDEEYDVQVWVDKFIANGILEKRIPGVAKYAWVCESKAIIPELREGFNNPFLFDAIINAYDGIFTCDQELVDMHEKIHFCFAGSNLPWTPEKKYKIYDKTEFCSFVSSSKKITKGHELRHKVYNLLRVRHVGNKIVRLMGGITEQGSFGLEQGCWLPEYTGSTGNKWHDKSFKSCVGQWHNKSTSLCPFMYSIVIENDQYDDYFTEKITDCFSTGTIPVYYGTENIG